MRRGFPIRTSADQRSLASPRGFSQRATSFIASWRQGIHRTLLSRSSTTSTRTQDQAPHETANGIPKNAQQYSLTHSHNQSDSPVKQHAPSQHRPSQPMPRQRQTRRAATAARDTPESTQALGQRIQTTWRRSGSNRRPPACKAGALPLSYAPKGSTHRKTWWAREDLNLRPHAYQACALTN